MKKTKNKDNATKVSDAAMRLQKATVVGKRDMFKMAARNPLLVSNIIKEPDENPDQEYEDQRGDN